ncbi:hypothetical protein HHK36_018712 [Tetracentron sinense]|uniref:Uncharacterized protein n=1 Tax=Tetracentron sinense TaxID=13715 RepID=A0A834YWE6_TETSI|nr:hypothetical protein HHK36_018712 [Tetracentron sinense]
MASTEGLVPITRTFLARYYDKYPFAPLSDDVYRLSVDLRSTANDLLKESPATQGESVLAREADYPTPHKIDENMWKNREHIEEILFLLERSHWPTLLQQQSTAEEIEIAAVLGEFKVKFQNTLKILEAFQSKNAENVFNTVMTYMPQDFRGTLIRQQRERSERNKQAEIDALVNSSGSIRDRYALLWKQQMERRRQLAQLGSATGVYKTLVKYLVGVPQVLLDFIGQINDDQGPMEEQRQCYGPSLYSLTTMALSIRLFLLLWWGRFEARNLQKDKVAVLEQAVHVYTSEFERFIKFIGTCDVLLISSPLFHHCDAGLLQNQIQHEARATKIIVTKVSRIARLTRRISTYFDWRCVLRKGFLKLYIQWLGSQVALSNVGDVFHFTSNECKHKWHYPMVEMSSTLHPMTCLTSIGYSDVFYKKGFLSLYLMDKTCLTSIG